MGKMLDYLKLDVHPKANPEAIVQVGPVRFTVLTSKLIRLEYNPTETFEDRATQVFWHRKLPVPEFHQSVDGNKIIIKTDHLVLNYEIQKSGFYHRFLQIKLKEQDYIWKYGQQNNTNLLGTVRTLDRVNGATPLNDGLLSRTGWSMIDDSDSLVFSEEGWLEERCAHPEAKDLYFFGYGKAFTECLVDFQRLSGQVPILPRFALGNWWSRYWEYHQDELVDLMHNFRKREIPLSVCIVDMDWHIVDTGNPSSGWTGYTWNPDLFPEPQRFLNELNEMGLKTALNLHPASGVYPHETQYEAFAEQLGIDPGTEQPIPFDIADPKFTKAYFEILHHPLEEMGVDFWWMDWQQGTKTTVEGLDPLFWLNHLHFYDRARDGITRPFIFSRWGGLGSHRYPIGFSGDTFLSWDTLNFQPYFTATAANVGYGWWSHDIGGHMGGIEEPELYLRWLQYGVFSPILRLHATKNPYHERRPWGFDAETEIHASNALRLRHAMVPYLYTAAWINHKKGILPIRPMYHLFPEDSNAYRCPNEYTFGSELIAVPFTRPTNENTRLSRQVLWLPEGDWFDFFTGKFYEGDGWYTVYGGLERIPVFAKAGAIIPLGPSDGGSGVDLPATLTVHIFPRANNTYQLYEDDGETQAYLQGALTLTKFNQSWENNKAIFTVEPVEGDISLLSEKRIFNLIFHALQMPVSVSVKVNGAESKTDWHYDETNHQLILNDITLPVQARLTVKICGADDLINTGDHRRKQIEHMLKSFRLDTHVKQSFADKLDLFMSNPAMLINFADRMEDSHLLALIETWLGKQNEKIADNPEEAFQRVIDNMYHP
jgi:alpha-glucosidase (family GH31 glycosyl hydrolase)